jgi:hypothetical protein
VADVAPHAADPVLPILPVRGVGEEGAGLKDRFVAAIDGIGDARSPIKFKRRPTAENLAEMNGIISEWLSPECTLSQINKAVYAAAKVISSTHERTNSSSDLRRKQQLDDKIKGARQDASRLQCVIDALKKGITPTPKVRQYIGLIRRQHHTLRMSVLALLRQKATDRVRSLTLARDKLVKRIRWVQENNTFSANPSRLFGNKPKTPDAPPTATEVERFWKGIYEKPLPFEDTPALARFRQYSGRLLRDLAECPPVSVGEVEKAIKGRRNFAAPGTDGIHTFWWKAFPSVHPHLARVFTSLLEGSTPFPAWLSEGRTVLIPKSGDLSRPQNYRPITCLNTLYKIFTGVLNERILASIEPLWNSVVEQRGVKRGVAGCKENLLIDRCICQDAVYYKRNLSMAWVDYKKAFDSTSHSLIIEMLRCLKLHPNIVRCIEDLIPTWRTRFVITQDKHTTTTTGWVHYKRGVFQGDSLSPLLFCISLLPLSIELRTGKGYMVGPPGRREAKVTHLLYMDDLKLYSPSPKELTSLLNKVSIFSTAVGMELGMDKCNVYHLNRGRAEDVAEDVQLVDGSIIRHLDAGERYKFLGVLQSGVQDVRTVKNALRSRYKARLRQIWKSCLSAKNKVIATSMLAVPLLSYSFGVLKWNVDELHEIDRETRKLLNIHRSLHPKSSVQRLSLPRHIGGRGLVNIEGLHNRVVLEISQRVLASADPLMQLVNIHEAAGAGAFLYGAARRAAGILGLQDLAPPRIYQGAVNIGAKIRKAEVECLMQEHMSKPMHSVFFRHVRDSQLSPKYTFAFLNSSGLKSETEGFVVACQDGVVNTLVYRNRIFQENIDTSCRACKRHPETITHILSACPTYAQSLYINRHNAALRVLYFHLRFAYGLDEQPILPYVPQEIESVVSNSRCRLYWNYAFPTSRLLRANKPDIVLLDFNTKEIFLIEFSAPAETNVNIKEAEKRDKYRDLSFEFGRLYPGHSIKMVVLIIGSLGGMKDNFVKELDIVPACRSQSVMLAYKMQKAVILGSLHIVRAHGVTS